MDSVLNFLPSLIPSSFYPSLRTLLIRSLRLGPLPQHVGFIMDGNRRFSRTLGLPVDQGHLAGFEALKRVLELLLRLEVPNVTVYAFAICNFNRSPEEVSKLMNLARTKLLEICEKGQLLDQYGIRVVVIGRKDLLPMDIQASVAKVESMTAHNKRGCLNVAFPYSSQEEMATVICHSVQESNMQNNPPNSITIDTLSNHTYTSHSPPLDILVRTSGVHRLSDFLLWQSTLSTQFYDTNSQFMGRQALPGPSVHFVPRYWPDFGILDVLPIILGWQAEQLWLALCTFFCQVKS